MLNNAMLQAGDEIDHYALLREVDRAPLATIFVALDKTSGAQVMIRVPDPGAETDPSFAARLKREEEIYRHLDHPGLIQVIPDDGRTRLYLVTTWFDGQPLRRLLEQGKLPPARAIALALRIGDALGYLHDHGIVVRDLSPDHILVNDRDEIKLTEFEAAGKSRAAQRLTFANLSQLVRATAYTAPEELAGERGDARADVFALGVILYEMLTGRIPWDAAPLQERRARKPIPPRSLEPGLSPALETVLLRALKPEVRERYAGIAEFVHDLTHLDQVGAPAGHGRQKLNRVALYIGALVIPLVLFGLIMLFLLR